MYVARASQHEAVRATLRRGCLWIRGLGLRRIPGVLKSAVFQMNAGTRDSMYEEDTNLRNDRRSGHDQNYH